MQEEPAQSLTPPGELRPAQLGIVLLGRVVLGHISATLVDLAQRGFLRIDEVPGDDPDWLLTDLRDQAADRSALLRFEATLLDGLFAQQSAVRLSGIGQALIPALNRIRAQLNRDAIWHGRLRLWHRDQRTPRGEQLFKQIQVFRRELRALAASGNSESLAALVPYAMIFGLGVPSAVSFDDVHDTGTVQRRENGPGWSQSDRFATSWLAACAGFSASPRHGHGQRSGTAQSGDFAHEWSTARDHGHGSHGHGSGHGGYDGGYGDAGGGHSGGGGFGGGGHGGH